MGSCEVAIYGWLAARVFPRGLLPLGFSYRIAAAALCVVWRQRLTPFAALPAPAQGRTSSPAAGMAASARTLLFQLYLIVQWIVLSSTIILFNKYLLSTTGFHFPLTLVMMHMAFVAACAHLWRAAGWTDSPAISWRDVGTRFLPIAALFAASLGLGNAAYLYISVAFVQMLKASTPVAVLLASFAFRLEHPSGELMLYIVVIAMGVALACYSQLQISVLGVTLQLLAVVAEALRLCLVNIALTAHNIKLPTVTFLSVIAPLCALVLVPPWLLTEASSLSADGFAPLQRVGAPILLANASVAFLLNLSTMALSPCRATRRPAAAPRRRPSPRPGLAAASLAASPPHAGRSTLAASPPPRCRPCATPTCTSAPGRS